MQIARRVLIDELLPMLDSISQMQKQGTAGVNPKVSYAMSRNYNMAMDQIRAFQAFQKKKILEFVNLDKDGNAIIIKNNEGKDRWDFKNETAETAWKNVYEEWANEEVEFAPYKFSEEDLQQCHNIPIHALAVMEATGMITAFQLEKAPLRKL